MFFLCASLKLYRLLTHEWSFLITNVVSCGKHCDCADAAIRFRLDADGKMAKRFRLASPGDSIWFQVELVCTKTNQACCEKVVFPESAPPATIKDVKAKVEEDLSIPACVQRLTYEAYPLSDCTNLEVARIRSGDTFQVSYSSEGDCEDIKKAVRWFEQVKNFLEREDPTLDRPMSNDFRGLVKQGLEGDLFENLAFQYFVPWDETKKYVNKLFFVQCGGLDVIMEVYALLHRHPWTQCELHLKHLEQEIILVLWNFSETFEIRRLMLARNGLELCIQSLLRQRVKEGERIEDTVNDHHWRVLMNVIVCALGLLCK